MTDYNVLGNFIKDGFFNRNAKSFKVESYFTTIREGRQQKILYKTKQYKTGMALLILEDATKLDHSKTGLVQYSNYIPYSVKGDFVLSLK